MALDKKIIGIIIAVIVILAIILYGSGALGNGGDEEVVQIGYLPSDHDSALFVANATGLYEKNGIKIELYEYNNGGDLMSAIASGELDVGYVGVTSVVSSIANGVPAKIIAGAQTEGSGLVSHDASVTSVEDLKGKTVATPGKAAIQDVLLRYDLQKHGLSYEDVEAPGMKVASMNDALKTGSVDAILTYEPYVSVSELVNGQHIVERSEDIYPNHPCCVVVATEKFLNERPDTAQKIKDIHKEATEKIIENPNDIIQYLPAHIVISEEAEQESLTHINWITGLDDDYKENVQGFLQMERDIGVLNETLTNEQLFA